jgi:hypothetical protein
MAGTRSAPSKHYAWSDIYNGGEVIEVQTALGTRRNIISQRNMVRRGEEITQDTLKSSDEEWNHWIETGTVRPYPLPEDADDFTSPTQAVLASLSKGGEIDQNVLLELALTQPAVAVEPEPEPEVPKGA